MRLFASLAVLFLLCLADRLHADTVELTNGDLVSGKVVSLDEDQLLLHSDLLGEMKIAREKVASIFFGDRKPQATARAAASASATAGATRKKAADEATDIDSILRQLKEGKGDVSKLVDKEFPLLQEPDVQDFFNETVAGLISGDLSIEDLRQKAIDVREQVRELEKELGPDAVEALKPYTGILDKFIRDAEPAKKAEPSKKDMSATKDVPK